MRGWKICFFINLFVCICAKGQQISTPIRFAKQTIFYDTAKTNIYSFKPLLGKLVVNTISSAPVKRISSTFYFNSIGFFCQKELQVEKALSFPVKFRLGSVAYTDDMEGKGKGISLPANRK